MKFAMFSPILELSVMSIRWRIAASFAGSIFSAGGGVCAAGFAGAACPGVACGAGVGVVLGAGVCASAGPAAHSRPASTAVRSFMEISCSSLQALGHSCHDMRIQESYRTGATYAIRERDSRIWVRENQEQPRPPEGSRYKIDSSDRSCAAAAGAGLGPAPREEAALDGCAGRADGRRQNPAGGGRAAARYDNFSGVSPALRNFVMIGVTISATNRRAGSVAQCVAL